MSQILDFQADKNGAYLVLAGSQSQQVVDMVSQYLIQNGYKMESGTPEYAVWGKGNKTMRVLFGAFVKRYAFNVMVHPLDDGNTRFEFTRKEKGNIGGVIGHQQVVKELDRHKQAFRNMF